MSARPAPSRNAAEPAPDLLQTLAGMTLAMDIAHGWDEEHSRTAAALAWHLAAEAGESRAMRADVYLGSLLLYLGCTGAALAATRFTDDDRALRGALSRLPMTPAAGVQAVLAGNTTIGSKLTGLAAFGRSPRGHLQVAAVENCGAARDLALQLGCSAGVVACLEDRFEYWNGQGAPHGKAAEAISPVARIARAAHFAVHNLRALGADETLRLVREVTGVAIEPRWAQAVSAALPVLADDDAVARIETRARLDLELTCDLDAIVGAFADFSDLLIAPFEPHARRVHDLATRAGRLLALDAATSRDLGHAALLHDVGQVALPTTLWLLPRVWTPAERRRAQGHSAATERILLGAPGLAGIAELAASHHERLDARGYPRRVDRSALERPARLLAVADAACGRLAPRPWRPAMTQDRVLDELARDVDDGALDRTCVEAVAAALTERPFAGRVAGTLLSDREREVLRTLADGHTNKAIGRLLGISHRTVQTHTLRIYEKLGVDSRAGAVLAATRKGLL